MKQSETKTIIGALQALAHGIVTDDGVVNACLIEAAERLQSLSAEVEQLRQALHDARIENSGQAAELERLRDAFTARDTGIQQTLGKALGYPWFKDDQKNFLGSTQEHGVCVGDHVAESLADEAAEVIGRLHAERRWIPVEERLPEPSVYVVALQQNGLIHITFILSHTAEWATISKITHWMPLPPLPRKQEK